MTDRSEYAFFEVFTVSAFELFLLSADAQVLDALLGFLSPHYIVELHGLSRRTAAALQYYMRRVWDLDKFLLHWFAPAVVPDFYRNLDDCNAIVSGSAVLRFLQRAAPYPDSDLDIFVSLRGLLHLGRWLQHRAGYTYRPRGDGPLIFFDVAALTLPSRWMAAKRREPHGYATLMFSNMFEVFEFTKEDTVLARRGTAPSTIQLVAVLGDPREHVLTFHSTAVMNYFTGSYVASLFPHSTFCHRTAWVCRGSMSVGYRSRVYWKEKYRRRDFRIVENVMQRTMPEPAELDGVRSIADSHTWFMFFGAADAVKARQEVELQDIPFEIVTMERGPVLLGGYMTIAPPFTLSACAFVADADYDELWPYGGTLETFSTFGA